MNDDELIAVHTADRSLVPIRFIESMNAVISDEQLVVDKLGDESRIEIRTVSGKEHTVKSSDMKHTVENIAHKELTPDQIIETIVTLWLRAMSK